MTVKINHGRCLLRLGHYTKRYIYQSCKAARECPLCECTAYQQFRRGIRKVLGDCVALRGGTDCSDCAWFWDSGLTRCVVDLAGVVDRVFGEGGDAVPTCEHHNKSNEGAELHFLCQRMVVGVP